MKKVSIVIGLYNSENTIEAVLEEIDSVFAGNRKYEYEMVLVDDYSPDGVYALVRKLAEKISGILESSYSIRASHVTVGKALELLGYSRQCNKKMEQTGKPAPDRNEQFEYINAKAQEFINAGEPVISK